jgi:hypothetical protein
MSGELTPKEIMRLSSGKKTSTALVNIDDPIGYEIRDLDDVSTLYSRYPFIPFFEGADATLAFYAKMRRLSPTHSGIINDLITFVTGGKMTVEKKQTNGFAAFSDTVTEVTQEEWNEYIEFIQSFTDPGVLWEQIERFYDGYKTWGNAFMEIVFTEVAGQRFAKIHIHDADRCRYLIPSFVNGRLMIGVSAEWNMNYLDRHPPSVIPVYPEVGEFADGTKRTIIHLKNPTVSRAYYGEPDSIGCIFFQFLEYQLGNYTTEGYLNRWIAKVFFETFGDAEDNADGNWIETFDQSIIDTFTQRGKNRKSVMHRNSPADSKETFIHEFAPNTDENFHTSMADIAETQILKAHNWNHLLLGVRISGSLGGGTEYMEVYKQKYASKIKPEQEMILEPFRSALKMIEDWVGYDNPNNLTIGLKDLYEQMLKDTAAPEPSGPAII